MGWRKTPAHSITPPLVKSPPRRPPPYPHPLKCRRYHRLLRDHYSAQAVTIFSATPTPFSYSRHADPRLVSWRENFNRVRVLHEATGFVLTGAIDDLWIDRETKELIVVD
jgi:hypothetical protein